MTATRSERLEALRQEISSAIDDFAGIAEGLHDAAKTVSIDSAFRQKYELFRTRFSVAAGMLYELKAEAEKLSEHVCPVCSGEGSVLKFSISAGTAEAVDCGECGGEGEA